jgi:serine/threonine-protein kinase
MSEKRTKLGVAGAKGGKKRDRVGTVLAGYQLERELGRGAMGTVYKGHHTKVGRDVAIKVMHPHLMHDTTLLARFRREAKLAGRLRHINVVCVIDVTIAPDNSHLIVFDLAPGVTLSKLIDGPMPRRRAIGLVRQILLGLEHAHDMGLIHRDLKPDNILVETRADGAEIPRIVDFGIAALREPGDSPDGVRLTASGEMIGTPMYMAPEQARCEPFDHRVDLFALGVIVYELLCGDVPFEGSAIEIALANANKDPPRFAERVPGLEVDPLLEMFARKLMARGPGERFATARAALDLLDLMDLDRGAAATELGVMDTVKASGIITLPEPRKR